MRVANLGRLFVFLSLLVPAMPSWADTAAEIDRDSRNALEKLIKENVSAKVMNEKAKAVLVFPNIIKAGLILGGKYGEGALIKGGKTAGYYATAAASFGLQAGAQTFGYAMFFMSDKAVKYLDKSDGWEVGTDPNVVVVDKGAAGAATTSTVRENIYVFFFDQQGLMAGLSLEGNKVSKITPDG
jgi:lipid-binding SYLF domain-containing protein